MPEQMRVIGYVRVSTSKQADGLSLDTQRERLQQYANLYGHDLVCVFEDNVSGAVLNRSGMNAARMMLAEGSADALMVTRLDRLTRSLPDLQVLLDSHFNPKSGKHLILIREQVDTSSASGRLVLNILTAVNEFDRISIGERTAAALAHKKAKGEFIGGGVPYGYLLATDGVSLTPNRAERAVIKTAMKHRLTGVSLREVGRRLGDEGFFTRKGTVFGAKQVARALVTGADLLEKGEL